MKLRLLGLFVLFFRHKDILLNASFMFNHINIPNTKSLGFSFGRKIIVVYAQFTTIIAIFEVEVHKANETVFDCFTGPRTEKG